MSGHAAWGEIKRSGQSDLEQSFDAAISVSLWLPELRRQAGLTQEQLASRLGVSQSWISQIEHETDVRLSTISAYVAALGGQLRLHATLPGGEDIDLKRMPIEHKLEHQVTATG
jgi:transcriptional regulator with XRE-family HTH domain